MHVKEDNKKELENLDIGRSECVFIQLLHLHWQKRRLCHPLFRLEGSSYTKTTHYFLTIILLLIYLFKILKECDIYACGKVAANQKCLLKLSNDKQWKQGQYEHIMSTDGITFFKWKDKRSVHIFSNSHEVLSKEGKKMGQKFLYLSRLYYQQST